MAGITLLLITAAMCFVLVILSNLAQAQTDESHSFEIIFLTNQNTELTGSITLQCRDVATAETLEIDDVKFWLNRTSACDLDLITRADVQVIIVDNNGMKFNLSRNLEGNYTCGRLSIQESGIIVKESTPKTMISLQTIVPVPRSLQTTFTVRAGDTAILPCPVPPGALLESYSVTWSKDDITVMFSDPRFDLNKAYSLVIHSVNLNDSSFNYRCVLCVTNPNTGTRREVRMYPDRDIPLTLHVIDEEITVSTVEPTSIIVRSLTEQPSFTCIANSPNITWTYTNSRGEETDLTEDGGSTYRITVSSVVPQQKKDGNYSTTVTKSKITFLELRLAQLDSALVRCKVSNSLGMTTAEPDGLFIITADYGNYSVPTIETTSCNEQDHAVLTGIIAASICASLITAAVSIGLVIVIVVCCYCKSKTSSVKI